MYPCKNEVQEPWPSRRYTKNTTERRLKYNIKLPQPFEDFADNHVVLRNLFIIRSSSQFFNKFNLLNVNRKVRVYPSGKNLSDISIYVTMQNIHAETLQEKPSFSVTSRR